jgi:hypothetical protein
MLCAQLVHVRLSSLFHLSSRARASPTERYLDFAQRYLDFADRWIAVIRLSLRNTVSIRYGDNVARVWEETWATKGVPGNYRCSCQSCQEKSGDDGEWRSPACMGRLYGRGRVFERWLWEVDDEVDEYVARRMY